MKSKRIILLGIISFLFCTSLVCNALTDIEEYKYNSSKKITSQNDVNSMLSVTSKQDEEVGLLVSDGEIKLRELHITKRGSSKSVNSDFYGSNAALLVYKGAKLVSENVAITTYGENSIGMYASKNGKIDVSNTTITTNNAFSFGVSANEGEILAKDIVVLTEDSNSAAIKCYSGANVNITNGDIRTLKDNSPIIDTAAKVEINESSLETEFSNGIVIENGGEVLLNKSELYTMNSSAESPKNIYMYQSSKKDSTNTIFSATSSEIVSAAGEAFNITNTNAIINLKDNKFSNNMIDFLKAEKTTGEGADVTLNLEKQVIEGNIVADASSKVSINMGNKSRIRGSLLGTGKNIELNIDESSFIVLTADSYITRLNNDKKDNSNIYLNNHKLYLNDEEVKGNDGVPPELYEAAGSGNSNNRNDVKEVVKPSVNITIAVILIVVVLIITIAIVAIIAVTKNNKSTYR